MMATTLLYLEDPLATQCEASVMGLAKEESGLAVHLDRSPFYPRGGGQPSDTGWIAGPTGRMRVERVEVFPDGSVLHQGHMVAGMLREGDEVTASIDAAQRRRNAKLHTAGEVICAAVHELGKRWAVSAASHVPGQSRVAFTTDLSFDELPAFMDRLKAQVVDIIGRNEAVLTYQDVAEEDVRRLCPLDGDGLETKKGGIRLVSPVRGFHRPCTGAHLASTGDIGGVDYRKVRLRGRDLSINYDVSEVE